MVMVCLLHCLQLRVLLLDMEPQLMSRTQCFICREPRCYSETQRNRARVSYTKVAVIVLTHKLLQLSNKVLRPGAGTESIGAV